MTTSVLASSGGDYATWSAWESAISADPTVEQVGEQRDSNDLGSVTINVSNTNNVDIKMTVQPGNGYRFNEKSDWPNCAAIEGVPARIEGTGHAVSIATNNVIVEWIVISATTSSTNLAVRYTTAAADCTLRYCCIWSSRTDTGTRWGVRGGYTGGGGTTNTVTIHSCFFWGVTRAIWAIDNSFDIKNVTIHLAGPAGTSAVGIEKQTGSGSNTVTCNNCVVLGDDFVECYRETTGTFSGSDNNMGSDTSAPGTTTYDSVAPAEFLRNPNRYEEDLHGLETAAVREWPDDLVAGWSGEGNNLDGWTSVSNVAVASAAAWRGGYGGAITVTGSGSFAGRWEPTVTDTTIWFVMAFRLRSGFSMGSGENFDTDGIRHSSGSQVFKLRWNESGGNYRVQPIVLNPSTTFGSQTTLTVGTWYILKAKIDFQSSGECTVWIGPAGGTLTQVVTVSGSLAGVTFGRWDWLSSGVDSGTSGTIDFDHIHITTSDTDEADDATSPFGDDNDGVYIGSSNAFGFDIDGDTPDTDDIGAHDYSVAASGGTKSDNRMLLLGVGR